MLAPSKILETMVKNQEYQYDIVYILGLHIVIAILIAGIYLHFKQEDIISKYRRKIKDKER